MRLSVNNHLNYTLLRKLTSKGTIFSQTSSAEKAGSTLKSLTVKASQIKFENVVEKIMDLFFSRAKEVSGLTSPGLFITGPPRLFRRL